MTYAIFYFILFFWEKEGDPLTCTFNYLCLNTWGSNIQDLNLEPLGAKHKGVTARESPSSAIFGILVTTINFKSWSLKQIYSLFFHGYMPNVFCKIYGFVVRGEKGSVSTEKVYMNWKNLLACHFRYFYAKFFLQQNFCSPLGNCLPWKCQE